MKIYKKIADLRSDIKIWKKNGDTVGLVPTMGYLHAGHASLVERARKENKRVIVSIFVNPIQFGANEDLSTYPRDFEKDCKLLESLNIDGIFSPEPSEMYPDVLLTSVKVQKMSEALCGKTRPSHFEGVTTVVAKLFNIAAPDRAYFGLKDYQQFQIISKMVSDLNFDVEIVGMPIVREADGLAMSSRNVYLTKEQRQDALLLSKSLNFAKEVVKNGEQCCAKIIKEIENIIKKSGSAKIDYVKIVDGKTLEELEFINKNAVILLAVYFGKARLIDNSVIF